MCGIIGYCGRRPAVPVIIEGLRRLEYRGYDSSGVAYVQNKRLKIIRAEGKLGKLEEKLQDADMLTATSGMGHTRWATHGLPVERNAHPHVSNDGCVAVVHNGIIENFQELREELKALGHVFQSETDTETLAHLISEGRKKTGDVGEALSWALSKVDGAYALVVVCQDEPGVLWAARKSSPLVLGAGAGENFLASDVPAFLPYTREAVFLDDGELVRLDASSWRVMDAATLAPVDKTVHHVAWDIQSAQKGGHKHFMIKEIFEQPRVIADCLTGRFDKEGRFDLSELAGLPVPDRLHIVACGTSY